MYSSGTSSSSGSKKRNLPSWISSRQNKDKSDEKKPEDAGAHDEIPEGETRQQAKGSGPNLGATNFSKLLEGVVFVLSGFVNPERGQLRSQALAMGAEYQADWNSDCTLLVCAFPNTPKFRQVEADGGTIIRKEWISECYSNKKLVDIESFLMHAGKPWRRQSISREASQVLADQEPRAPRKSPQKVESREHMKSTAASSSKRATSSPAKDHFTPSELKKWAMDDLEKTISWLESQDEKPEPSEIKKIAAEGILTCLQDTIDSLKQGQSMNQITDQWSCIPRVVEELIKLGGKGDGPRSVPLEKQAMSCKKIYEVEFGILNDESLMNNKKQKKKPRKHSERQEVDYDSDETIEMTEEEIDQAYKYVASTLNA